MKLTGVGPMAGLAYVNPTMEIYKMRMERERLNMEQQKQAYAINKDLAADMEVGVVKNKYDHEKQTAFAADRIKYIGKYIRNNPDFLTNPDKYMHVKGLARELRDNKWTQRSEQFQEQSKLYYDAIQKNPSLMRTPSYIEMANKLGRRKETGSVDGDDQETEFNYEPPFTWDEKPEETLMKMGEAIQKQFKMMPEINGYGEFADPAQIDKVTDAVLSGIQGEQYQAMWGDDTRMMVRGLVEAGSKPRYQGGVTDSALDWAKFNLAARQSQQQDAPPMDAWGEVLLPGIKTGQVKNIPTPLIDEVLGKTGEINITDSKGKVLKTVYSNSITNGGSAYSAFNKDGQGAIGFGASVVIPVSEAVNYGFAISDALKATGTESAEELKELIAPTYAGKGKYDADATFVIDPTSGKVQGIRVNGHRIIQYNDYGTATHFNQRSSKQGDTPYTNRHQMDQAWGSYQNTETVKGVQTIILPNGKKYISEDGINLVDPETGATGKASMNGQPVVYRNGIPYNRKTGKQITQ